LRVALFAAGSQLTKADKLYFFDKGPL